MRQRSPGLIFFLQGYFAFSEGFGPSLKEKRKYAPCPPPTNQKQFVFGQNGEKWKITSISLFSLTQFLHTFPMALKSVSLLKKFKDAYGYGGGRVRKDASNDVVFPWVFMEFQMHWGT